MTIILVLTIIFCFALLGYKLASYYINRRKFFYSLQLLLTNLELDVAFSQDKLKNLISKNIDSISSKELSALCSDFYNALNERNKLSFDDVNRVKILKKDEKDMVFNIFSSLGKYDAYSQSKEINNYKNKVNEFYSIADEECKKYASLFIKLGVIIGVLVCLLII